MLFFHLITTTRQRWRAGFAFFYWFQQDPELVGAVCLLERNEVPIRLAILLVLKRGLLRHETTMLSFV